MIKKINLIDESAISGGKSVKEITKNINLVISTQINSISAMNRLASDINQFIDKINNQETEVLSDAIKRIGNLESKDVSYDDSEIVYKIDSLEYKINSFQKQMDSLRKELIREVNRAQNDVERLKKVGE